MSYYDEQLKQLGVRLERLRQIDAERKRMEEQKRELEKKLFDLDLQRQREQQDVDRLEGRSLMGFFYRMTGGLREKLSKEREEALAAAEKYDAAQKELAAIEAQMDDLGAEAGMLRECEEQYQTLFKEKTAALRRAGGDVARQLDAFEQKAAANAQLIREIDEAMTIADRAHDLAYRIADHLDSAKGYGTWDMLGGGLIADAAKHSELDDAQRLIDQLQWELARLKTELADVQVDADMHVEIDGFLHFADFFFDGLFADWAVMDRIGSSQEQANKTIEEIGRVVYRLRSMRERANGDRLQAIEDARRLVLRTPL